MNTKIRNKKSLHKYGVNVIVFLPMPTELDTVVNFALEEFIPWFITVFEKKKKCLFKLKTCYNVYIHKLKLSINYSDLNMTLTPHAGNVSMHSQGKFLIQD